MFKSKSVRFGEAQDSEATPGPGQYSRKSEWVKRKGKPKPQYDTKLPSASAAITWVRVPTAPSIPAPNQSYGYEEGEYGELIMQRPPHLGYTGKVGDVPGPGEYESSDKQNITSTRTIDFSKSRSKRSDFSKTSVNTPGPGHYNTSATNQSERIIAPSAVFQSRVARKSSSDLTKDIPGPGAYQFNSTFNKKEIPETLQFFGSTTQRFRQQRASQRTNPYIGPGTYNVSAVSSFEDTKKSTKTGPASLGVGFASTSGREVKMKEVTPGAGTYDVHLVSSIETDLKKKLVSRSGVFGTTTKRFISPTEDQPSNEPVNSFQQQNNKQQEPIKHNILPEAPNKPSASFASTSTRFDHNNLLKEVKPAPGEYEVGVKWVKGRHGLFNSGGTRFNTLNDNGLPGPGQYNAVVTAIPNHNNDVYEKPKGNHMISSAARFAESTSAPKAVPGPGYYDSEYPYGNLNKPTFNMVIAQASLRNSLL